MARQPIPKHAQRVFSGVLFDVYQWKQTMYDGSVAVFERLRRPDTAQVIPVVGERILILSQIQPGWDKWRPSLAGGRVDRGETPRDAAVRELLEETGYESDAVELLCSTQPVNKIDWTVYTYIARHCKRISAPKPEPGEKIQTKLLSFDEFLALGENPDFYERELKAMLIAAQYKADAREALRRRLFGA